MDMQQTARKLERELEGIVLEAEPEQTEPEQEMSGMITYTFDGLMVDAELNHSSYAFDESSGFSLINLESVYNKVRAMGIELYLDHGEKDVDIAKVNLDYLLGYFTKEAKEARKKGDIPSLEKLNREIDSLCQEREERLDGRIFLKNNYPWLQESRGFLKEGSQITVSKKEFPSVKYRMLFYFVQSKMKEKIKMGGKA